MTRDASLAGRLRRPSALRRASVDAVLAELVRVDVQRAGACLMSSSDRRATERVRADPAPRWRAVAAPSRRRWQEWLRSGHACAPAAGDPLTTASCSSRRLARPPRSQFGTGLTTIPPGSGGGHVPDRRRRRGRPRGPDRAQGAGQRDLARPRPRRRRTRARTRPAARLVSQLPRAGTAGQARARRVVPAQPAVPRPATPRCGRVGCRCQVDPGR
jgi:hypothetical protein